MKKSLSFITIFLILLLSNTFLKAQQEAQFTHYFQNFNAYNPGFAGVKNSICATALYRNQWLGFSEVVNGKEYNVNPRTMLLAVDAYIKPLHGGLNLIVYNDKLGFENNTGVKIGYSYNFYIRDYVLGVGFNVHFLDKGLDFSLLNPLEDNDPLLIQRSNQSDMVIDADLGAFLLKPNQFWVGLSSLNLIQSSAQLSDVSNIKLKRHYYITGGYIFSLNNDQFEIRPSTLIKTDFVSAQYDINVQMYYQGMVWAGVGYRVQDAVMLNVGAQPFANSSNQGLAPLSFGYSYDFTTSAIGRHKVSSGSHEVFINYCFLIEKKTYRQGNRNVRFL
jgi:type IX secretion system PorP/SprF family membrane protein